jgi:hypothetical protein
LFPLAAQDPADLKVVDRIKSEAFERSKVMDHLYYLTDVYGPRLTGSPEFEQAAKWAMERLESFGVTNVHMEKWGPFGRPWSAKEYWVEQLEPRYQQLNAAPLAWSGPTNGAVSGELILAPLAASWRSGPKKAAEALKEYQAKWTGKLKGKIVLVSKPRVPEEQSRPQFHRYTDAELADMAKAPEPSAKVKMKTVDELEWPENPDDLGKFLSSIPEALFEKIWDQAD